MRQRDGGHDAREVTEFGFDVRGVFEGLGDVVVEDQAESFPQPVDRDPDGAFTHSVLPGGLGLTEGFGVADQPGFEDFEVVGATGGGPFVCQGGVGAV